MHAVTNRRQDLLPLAPQVIDALAVTPIGSMSRAGV